MATITLKEGDFGSEVDGHRRRGGALSARQVAAGTERDGAVDRGRRDRGPLRRPFRPAEGGGALGARGFLTTGNPLGLAAGVFAVTKVKDVEFAVRLKDDRRFVATADAAPSPICAPPAGLALASAERGSRGGGARRCGDRQVSRARRAAAGAPAGGGRPATMTRPRRKRPRAGRPRPPIDQPPVRRRPAGSSAAAACARPPRTRIIPSQAGSPSFRRAPTPSLEFR